MPPRIVTLAERPDLVATVASWQWREWGRPRGRRLESVTHEVEGLVTAIDEAGFVLLNDETPLGTACLTALDLDTRPDLSPWLASVFVEPDHRGRGHATRLIRAVERAAGTLGHAELWLFTATSVPLYRQLGWQVVGAEQHHGAAVMLMRKAIIRAVPPPVATGH
jgi:GNAT superfamily N-acetyltransferase